MNIYDMAKICGVSVASISRVINGKEGVGDERRKMIQDKLDEIGFIPKIAVSTFDTIAVIVAFEDDNPFSNSYIYEIIKGLSDVIFHRQKTFTIFSTLYIPLNKDEFRVFCNKHQIGGVIFLALRRDQKNIDDLASIIPTVALGSPYPSFKNITFINADNFEGAYSLTKYLISLGHNKISFAVPSLDSFEDHSQRFLGYKKALQDHGIPYNTRHLIEYDYTNYSNNDIGTMLTSMLTDKNISPTAIFCCDDQEAYRIFNILTSLGYKIPEDISIAGFDDYEMSSHFNPPLTTVKQPLIEEGRLAGNILCDAIEKRVLLRHELFTLPTELIIRKSVTNIKDKN